MRFWLKISICQISVVHKGCWVNCLTRVGNLEASTVCWRESARWVQLDGNQAAVDHISRVAVEDHMLSQEDKPQRHRSAHEILHERNCYSPFKCAQDNSPWSPAQMLQTTSCVVVVWSQVHIPSHLLINNLIICSKSRYCSIVNHKLNIS